MPGRHAFIAVIDNWIDVASDIETGRSVATRKDQKEPVWDVRYTSVWVREKKQWLLASEQHTAVR